MDFKEHVHASRPLQSPRKARTQRVGDAHDARGEHEHIGFTGGGVAIEEALAACDDVQEVLGLCVAHLRDAAAVFTECRIGLLLTPRTEARELTRRNARTCCHRAHSAIAFSIHREQRVLECAAVSE